MQTSSLREDDVTMTSFSSPRRKWRHRYFVFSERRSTHLEPSSLWFLYFHPGSYFCMFSVYQGLQALRWCFYECFCMSSATIQGIKSKTGLIIMESMKSLTMSSLTEWGFFICLLRSSCCIMSPTPFQLNCSWVRSSRRARSLEIAKAV